MANDVPYGSLPQRPEFLTPLDTSAWQLNPQVDLRQGEAYQNIRGQALGQSTPWQDAALNQQAAGQANQMDVAKLQQQGAMANAMRNMSMRGGIGTGSRERLQAGGQRDLLGATQRVGMQGMLDRANIGLQQQQQQNQMLGQMQGVEQANVGNILNQGTLQNAANAQQYSDQMRAWAATQSADAQANASSGGKK